MLTDLKSAHLPQDDRCGTCIGGAMLALGIEQRCVDCKGTGRCNHKWADTPIYKGKQWDASGTHKVPKSAIIQCANCAAYVKHRLTQDGSVLHTRIKHPADP